MIRKLLTILLIILAAGAAEEYRGIELVEIAVPSADSSYEIPQFRTYAPTLTEAKYQINAYYFSQVTGISDSTLIQMYIDADENKNGDLEWAELEAFQSKIHREYKYIDNEPVLRPDEFIRAGGGDCDDWSEMTAGLLRFYGQEPYIARFGRTKVIGHALCLVRVKPGTFPERYMYYELSGFGKAPAGIYIPIDYEVVGGLSGVDRRWKISGIDVPEEMYGEIR